MTTDTLDQLQDTERKGTNLNSNLSYTEPVGDKSMMMLSYTHVLNNNDADQKLFFPQDKMKFTPWWILLYPMFLMQIIKVTM